LSEHVVLIGAYGWQHKDWLGEFYPDDLPDEWQLGYYGNEYQVVLVPASYWSQGPDVFEEWLQESNESLKMICEWPAQGSTQAQLTDARRAIDTLSSRVLGVLVPLSREGTESELAVYKDLASQYNLCFDTEVAQREQLLTWLAEHLAGYDYSLCWRADPNFQQDLGLGKVSVTRISGNIEPKDLRVIIEKILAASNSERHMVLIVDGVPPSMQLLTNIGIILDLL
jgi:hypothetical protein